MASLLYEAQNKLCDLQRVENVTILVIDHDTDMFNKFNPEFMNAHNPFET